MRFFSVFLLMPLFLSLQANADGDWATMPPEKALEVSRLSGFIVHRLHEMRKLNERCIARRVQKIRCEEFAAKEMSILNDLTSGFESEHYKLSLYVDEIRDTLKEAQISLKQDEYNAVDSKLEKVEAYTNEAFYYAIGKEAENLWVERKIFMEHSISAWEWPLESFNRMTDIIRSYHDGAMQALGELGDNTDEKKRAVQVAISLSKKVGFNLQEVHVLNTPQVNAYVLGGNVYITKGILDYYTNDGDLGLIVGHEMGHIMLKHNLKSVWGQGATLAGTYVVSVVTLFNVPAITLNWIREKVGKKALFSEHHDQDFANWTLSRRSIRHELEADAFGIKASYSTYGWIPQRSVVVFKRLYDLIPLTSPATPNQGIFNPISTLLHKEIVPPYQTHPSLELRIESALKVADELKPSH